MLWRKLIVNAAINPITALTGLKNGCIADDSPSGIQQLAFSLAYEAMLVAKKSGVDLEPPAILSLILKVSRDTEDNTSSMLTDFKAGRPTEIDAINGWIMREGKGFGIPTYLNECVADAVKNSMYFENFEKLEDHIAASLESI